MINTAATREVKWINEKTAIQTLTHNGKQVFAQTPDYPSDKIVEMLVVAGIMSNGTLGKGTETFKRFTSRLQPYDFYSYNMGILWRIFEKLHERDSEINAETVRAELRSVGQWNDEIDDLITETLVMGSSSALKDHVDRVLKLSLLRNMMYSAGQIYAAGLKQADDLDDIRSNAEQALKGVTTRITQHTQRNITNIADAVQASLDQMMSDIENDTYQPGITTGLTYVDDTLLGYRPGKVYIVAGPSGSGKSAMIQNNALAAMKAGKQVLFFSLEMRPEELAERWICMEAGIDGTDFQRRNLSAHEIDRVNQVTQKLMDSGVLNNGRIVEMNHPTMSDITAKLDELQYTGGYDIVFIDYIGIEMVAQPRNSGRMSPTEHANHLWEVVREMRNTYDVPIVVASQINRDHANRKGGRPQLTDLSYSGLAEKAADVVMFVHRDVLFVDQAEYPNRAEIIIAKNRSGKGGGQTKVIYALYEDSYTRFSDWRLPDQGDYGGEQ